ncbi:MAG: aldehyde dehydrogenase (NADP(+)) [Chloroflexi bacterium]|nr:aldehyde dehydrogenase (NADP(+)) [Chloroflexota bacterium]
MTLTGAHYIAGTNSREGSAVFTSVNPRTGERSFEFVNATAAEIDRAVQAARDAFEALRHYPSERLAGLLDAIAAEIEALGDDLLTLASDETGLDLGRLTGERGRTTGQLRKFAALLREGSYVDAIIDTALPDRQPAPRPSIRRMLVPIGPVAVFAASNFPFAFSVAGGDTASALAAGCPVVVKAHPGHPGTSELVAQAVTRAVATSEFPAGTFSLVQGDRIDVGHALVQHPGIAAVGFTGSLRAGRALFDAAAARPVPIPVYAEMGSVNPVVLLPGAIATRFESLADGLVGSVTLGTGQFCTNPGLVFVIDGEDSRGFIQRVTEKMQAAQPGVLLNDKIQAGLVQAVAGTAAHPSVTVLTGGEALPGPACGYAHTVLLTDSEAFRADDALQAEHFGPVTLFVACRSHDDLLATLAALEGNLTATVHAADDEAHAAARVYAVLREKVGRLIWNGFPTGVEVVYAMQHGGPYPATTAPATTSVGMTAIRRFMRPLAFQNLPDALLPDALKDANPLGIWRVVDEKLTKDAL